MNLSSTPNAVWVEVPLGLWEIDAVVLKSITPPVIPDPSLWWKQLRENEKIARIRRARAKVLSILDAILKGK